jgi:hypothetical protein
MNAMTLMGRSYCPAIMLRTIVSLSAVLAEIAQHPMNVMIEGGDEERGQRGHRLNSNVG